MAAKYRRVDPRVWTDERFSPLSTTDKLIALYVLTAQSNRIGLFVFSPGKAAEELGLSPKTFRTGFHRVLGAFGWQWDEKTRVLYIDTWWKYNPPENANNVIGNLKDLDDLPQNAFLTDFVANTCYLPETLVPTFTKTLAERFPERYPKRSPSQEQEQEEDPPTPHGGNGRAQAGLSGFEIFWRAYPKKRSRGQAERAWRKIQPDDVLLGVMLGKLARARQTPDWTKEGGKFIPYPATWLNAKGWEDEYPANGSCSRPTRPSKVAL